MRRLPKKHIFPGGFRVEIVIGQPLEGNDADYETLDVDLGRITLSKQRTPRQLWRDLAHELVHAVVDAQNYIERAVAP